MNPIIDHAWDELLERAPQLSALSIPSYVGHFRPCKLTCSIASFAWASREELIQGDESPEESLALAEGRGYMVLFGVYHTLHCLVSYSARHTSSEPHD